MPLKGIKCDTQHYAKYMYDFILFIKSVYDLSFLLRYS